MQPVRAGRRTKADQWIRQGSAHEEDAAPLSGDHRRLCAVCPELFLREKPVGRGRRFRRPGRQPGREVRDGDVSVRHRLLEKRHQRFRRRGAGAGRLGGVPGLDPIRRARAGDGAGAGDRPETGRHRAHRHESGSAYTVDRQGGGRRDSGRPVRFRGAEQQGLFPARHGQLQRGRDGGPDDGPADRRRRGGRRRDLAQPAQPSGTDQRLPRHDPGRISGNHDRRRQGRQGGPHRIAGCGDRHSRSVSGREGHLQHRRGRRGRRRGRGPAEAAAESGEDRRLRHRQGDAGHGAPGRDRRDAGPGHVEHGVLVAAVPVPPPPRAGSRRTADRRRTPPRFPSMWTRGFPS